MPRLIEARMDGTPLAHVTQDTLDTVHLAMDGLLAGQAIEGVPPFTSFHHAARVITGGSLDDLFNPMKAMAREAISTGTLVNLMLSSMERRMIQGYQAVNYHLEAVSYPRPGGATSFRLLRAMRLQYVADLATVDPEAADYQEMAAPTDEAITYNLVQKGNLLTVTRKVMVNDDGGVLVGQLAERFGRSAARTLAKAVYAPLITNATYAVDSVALFNASHGSNLGSTALTGDATGAAAVLAALPVFAAQTEPGSGEKLGCDPSSTLFWLIVPTALVDEAMTLNGNPSLTTYHLFGANHERIVCLPFLSDATDWYVTRGDMPTVEVSYLNDQRTPEIMRAETPTLPQQLLSEKLQFKVRFEYGVGLVDYRGAFKSVVAG